METEGRKSAPILRSIFCQSLAKISPELRSGGLRLTDTTLWVLLWAPSWPHSWVDSWGLCLSEFQEYPEIGLSWPLLPFYCPFPCFQTARTAPGISRFFLEPHLLDPSVLVWFVLPEWACCFQESLNRSLAKWGGSLCKGAHKATHVHNCRWLWKIAESGLKPPFRLSLCLSWATKSRHSIENRVSHGPGNGFSPVRVRCWIWFLSRLVSWWWKHRHMRYHTPLTAVK